MGKIWLGALNKFDTYHKNNMRGQIIPLEKRSNVPGPVFHILMSYLEEAFRRYRRAVSAKKKCKKETKKNLEHFLVELPRSLFHEFQKSH